MSRFKVDEETISVLEFLASKISSSKKEIKRQIEHNACKVNGHIEHKASKKVSIGDIVEWNPRKLSKPSFDPRCILFEDEDLLIYNKPTGVTSDVEGILALLKPHGRFSLVHRLDKETSGVLILAKHPTAEKTLLALFKARKIEKQYVALVHGVPKQKGSIENYLGKIGSYQGQTLYGDVGKLKGKWAKTSWSVQKILQQAALVVCFPETGRTHQIRVHFSAMGHPILGDYQYGKYEAPRLMLHAYKVIFTHRGKKLSVCAPIPKDFQSMLN